MKVLFAIAAAGLFGFGAVKVASTPAGPLAVSREAVDLIIEFETGGKSYYEKRLKSPTWPGGASGVTIGLGYDLGYNTRDQIISDWNSLPKGTRDVLASAAGKKGLVAKQATPAMKWIIVPWQEAEKVFVSKTMPRFGKMTGNAFPNITCTHPHVQGSMLSIVFNRGASMTGSSRSEMRSIRSYIQAEQVSKVPAEIRKMKRLWVGKGLDGLLRRREAEARLVEKSLK